MLLLSWQSTECADALESGVPWRCDEAHAVWREEFADAYDWIASEMRERIGNPPDGVRWPIWSWRTYDFVDIEDGGRPSEDAMIDPHVEQDYVHVLMDVPDDLVLLSDEDAWTMVTMAAPVPPVEWTFEGWNEKRSAEFDLMLANARDERGRPTPETVATWDRIFDVRAFSSHDDRNGCFVQATTWEIRPEWVVRIERLHNEPHKGEYDYDFDEWSESDELEDGETRMTDNAKEPSTSTEDENRETSPKWAAYEMFGDMRSSTDDEREAHAAMLDRLSVPIEAGQSVFDLIDQGEDGDPVADR